MCLKRPNGNGEALVLPRYRGASPLLSDYSEQAAMQGPLAAAASYTHVSLKSWSTNSNSI
jgi:hypothetical protein